MSSKPTSQEPGGTPTFDPFTELWPTPRSQAIQSTRTGGKILGETAALSQSTSSAEGHPASPSATLDEGWEREMTVTSGRRCFGWYGNANLGGFYSRMFLASLLTRAAFFSPVCRLTWRMQATKSSRLLYFRLWPSVRRTGETEFSLWRSPTASEAGARVETLYTKDGKPARMGERAYRKTPSGKMVLQSQTLGQQVRYDMWLPTPSAHPGPNKNANAKQWGEAKSLDAMARTGLWPTPMEDDASNVTRASGNRASLVREVGNNLWPTPNAGGGPDGGSNNRRAAKKREMHVTTGRLNPAWVSLLMGAPADWCISTSNGNAELRGLGNAVVPVVVEHLGRLIMEQATSERSPRPGGQG